MFDHVCLMVSNMEWSLNLFREVFGFTVDRYVGDAQNPAKVWFREQLQLNRTETPVVTENGIFSHLGIAVQDPGAVIEKLKKYGGKATEDGENWIMMPNGIYLEILAE